MKVPIASIKVGVRKRRLDEEKVAELAESIQELGLLQPIGITKDSVLVFGLHRLEACRKIGWQEIDAEVVCDGDALRAELAQIHENLVRAELTALERAEHLARAKEIYEALHAQELAAKEAKKLSNLKQFQNAESVSLQDAVGQDTESDTVSASAQDAFTSWVARQVGVTDRTVQRAVQIASDIPSDVRDAIRETELADATRELLKLARLPEEEQRAVARVIADGKARKVGEAQAVLHREKVLSVQVVVPEQERVVLLHGDFREKMAELEDDSIDLIFTDPPYAWEYVPLYGELAAIAARKLKPGGSLIAYSGHQALGEVVRLMSEHLKFWWSIALVHSGTRRLVQGIGVYAGWKPLVWFVKGSRSATQIVDDVFFSEPPDKSYHEWAQSTKEAEYYISKLCPPGGLVVDPFAGSATTLIAAYRLGARSIGYEIDEARYKAALQRLSQVLSDQSSQRSEGMDATHFQEALF